MAPHKKTHDSAANGGAGRADNPRSQTKRARRASARRVPRPACSPAAGPPDRPKPILILGVGNILLRDEGVGVRVIEALQSMDLPGDVELYDGATAGADLAYCLDGRKRVIVIDCIHGDSPPGTVFRFTPEDVISQEGGRLSLHQIGLIDALRMAAQLGSAPGDVVIYGITPKELSYGLDLSPEIAAVIPKIVELVLSEISA